MNETKKHYLAEEPLGKLLLKFSVPCVLSMLVSALYNIVDQIFIGQGWGIWEMRPPMWYTLYGGGPGSGAAGRGRLRSALEPFPGKGEKESAHRCVGSGMMLCAAVGLVLMALGLAFRKRS